MEARFFYMNGLPVMFSDLQIAEGLAEGLYELTEAEKQALLNPAVEEVEWDYKHFTGQAKLDLFTESEQAAIIGAAYAGDIEVALVYERFKIADYLTYSDPRVEAGLNMLVQKGKLTQERKEAIVAEMTAERQH